MKRKSVYEVLLKRAFTESQWTRLEEAFFHHPNRGDYQLFSFGAAESSTFSISKVDHSYFTNAEINELYWFFVGVCCAYGFGERS